MHQASPDFCPAVNEAKMGKRTSHDKTGAAYPPVKNDMETITIRSTEVVILEMRTVNPVFFNSSKIPIPIGKQKTGRMAAPTEPKIKYNAEKKGIHTKITNINPVIVLACLV